MQVPPVRGRAGANVLRIRPDPAMKILGETETVANSERPIHRYSLVTRNTATFTKY